MEAVRPLAHTTDLQAPTREGLIGLGLQELLESSGALVAGAGLGSSGGVTLASIIDQSAAISRLIRGLGPEFTQGDWSPLVEAVHDATTQATGDMQAYLRVARRGRVGPRLLDNVMKTAAALKHLREEATLLAVRADWAR